MLPTPGSLFSPNGHPKTSTLPVSAISLLLNDVLKTTNNLGSCYSTPNAWSFAVPLLDFYDSASTIENYSSFYCIDSTGKGEELPSLPKGITCQ